MCHTVMSVHVHQVPTPVQHCVGIWFNNFGGQCVPHAPLALGHSDARNCGASRGAVQAAHCTLCVWVPSNGDFRHAPQR
jgi:hypothetical protein